jgi:hypothetical protein
MHALIVGGEFLGMPALVECGVKKLRQAVEMYRRNGFPGEYNSPNYTPVSLNPLAHIVEQAHDEEARELALTIERFFWQNLTLHWDPRCGLPTGLFSRGATLIRKTTHGDIHPAPQNRMSQGISDACVANSDGNRGSLRDPLAGETIRRAYDMRRRSQVAAGPSPALHYRRRLLCSA